MGWGGSAEEGGNGGRRQRPRPRAYMAEGRQAYHHVPNPLTSQLLPLPVCLPAPTALFRMHPPGRPCVQPTPRPALLVPGQRAALRQLRRDRGCDAARGHGAAERGGSAARGGARGGVRMQPVPAGEWRCRGWAGTGRAGEGSGGAGEKPIQQDGQTAGQGWACHSISTLCMHAQPPQTAKLPPNCPNRSNQPTQPTDPTGRPNRPPQPRGAR